MPGVSGGDSSVSWTVPSIRGVRVGGHVRPSSFIASVFPVSLDEYIFLFHSFLSRGREEEYLQYTISISIFAV